MTGSSGPGFTPQKFETCPVWGANTFLPQLEARILLTAAPAAGIARIRHIPQVIVRRALSPVGKEALRGSKLNPQG